MNRIDRLQAAYGKHIRVPWRDDASPEERVIFCVYNETNELILRARLTDFETETTKANHLWLNFDFTDTFALWLSQQRYRESYYRKPDLIAPALESYSRWLTGQFSEYVEKHQADSNTVVALTGVGALFGILKVRDVISECAPRVKGRLVVFFPGNYENNNYRLLDAYDGWNYLAVPITADTEL